MSKMTHIEQSEGQCPKCGMPNSLNSCDAGSMNADGEIPYYYECYCGTEYTEYYVLEYDRTQYEKEGE